MNGQKLLELNRQNRELLAEVQRLKSRKHVQNNVPRRDGETLAAHRSCNHIRQNTDLGVRSGIGDHIPGPTKQLRELFVVEQPTLEVGSVNSKALHGQLKHSEPSFTLSGLLDA